jgi:glycosyltransferase involved in cell wall biosynthesis
MKIITIYAKPIQGGYFSRLCKMITALATEKNEVHYLSTVEFPLRHPKIIFHKVPIVFVHKRFFYPQFFLFSSILLPFIMLRYKIDCMVVFGTVYTLTGFFGKILLHVRIFTFIRGDWISELRAKKKPELFIFLITIIEKMALRLSSNIISVNEDLKKKYILRYGKFAIEVFPNNIDTTIFYPRKTKEKIYAEFTLQNNIFLIGYIGTFNRIKRVDLLIHAFQMVSSSHTKLLLVGEGAERDFLEKLVAELHMEKSIFFSGWRNDVPDLLSAMDLLILPSDYEGCPGIILESLGCETPCIGSDVGGISELLLYQDLLFQPSNADHLAQKIKLILSDPDYYEKIKKMCLSRKDQLSFNWDKMINTYLVEKISRV